MSVTGNAVLGGRAVDMSIHYLVFGAVVWAFTFFGLALHVADVQRRGRKGEMPLDEYWRPRPIEWLLSGMLLLACAAAVLGAIQVYGLGREGTDLMVRGQLLVGAGLTAVALAYVGLRGKSWLIWAKDQFIHSSGATRPKDGKVVVNLELESKFDMTIIRKVAWQVYALGCIPLVLAALKGLGVVVLPSIAALLATVAGAMLVHIILGAAPSSEEDEDW